MELAFRTAEDPDEDLEFDLQEFGAYDREAFGRWVYDRRKEADLSQTELGCRVWTKQKSSKSTISHVESGELNCPPERRRDLVMVLAASATSNERSRRKLLIQGMQRAGYLAFTHIGGTYISTNEDDKLLDDHRFFMEMAPFALYHQEDKARIVMTKAVNLYVSLAPRYYRDAAIALAAVDVGEYLARAQDATFDWFEDRPGGASQTYTHILERVVLPALNVFPDEPGLAQVHARLLALRVPLYRELRRYRSGNQDAKMGIQIAALVGDIALQTDLTLNRAHVYAAAGQQEAWEQILASAAQLVADAPDLKAAARSDLEALQIYFRGEGLKRLAFNYRVELTWAQREAYATEALACLQRAFTRLHTDKWTALVTIKRIGIGGHPLLTQVSMAQCQVWMDQQRALLELDGLKERAEHEYPSLVAKIDFAQLCARKTLARKMDLMRLHRFRPDDPVPGFDLDAKSARGDPPITASGPLVATPALVSALGTPR